MGPEMLNYKVIRLFINGSAGLKLVKYPSCQKFCKGQNLSETILSNCRYVTFSPKAYSINILNSCPTQGRVEG